MQGGAEPVRTQVRRRVPPPPPWGQPGWALPKPAPSPSQGTPGGGVWGGLSLLVGDPRCAPPRSKGSLPMGTGPFCPCLPPSRCNPPAPSWRVAPCCPSPWLCTHLPLPMGTDPRHPHSQGQSPIPQAPQQPPPISPCPGPLRTCPTRSPRTCQPPTEPRSGGQAPQSPPHLHCPSTDHPPWTTVSPRGAVSGCGEGAGHAWVP